MDRKGKLRPVTQIILGLILGAALVGCWSVIGAPREKTPEEVAADKLLGSLIRCENKLKSSLADRDGFRVDPYGEWLVDPESGEDRKIYTFGMVGKNGFGALVHGRARCVVEYDGEFWTVTDLDLL